MKLPWEVLLLSLSTVHTSAAPLSPDRRSASFASLRGLTTLNRDFSTQESFSRPTKFFHESTFSPHYDGRFADHELPDDIRIHHLRLLLKTYMKTMKGIGVRTWLMHGCLLGWWWNGRIMPWDTDIDVMVDARGMAELGNWWNMSVHHFTADDLRGLDAPMRLPLEAHESVEEEEEEEKEKEEGEIIVGGKKYLLEVNPFYTNTSTKDTLNVIDGRWIDIATGLFIDITTLHIQPVPIRPGVKPFVASPPFILEEEEEEEEEKKKDVPLYTKDQHAYLYSQIFPLRESNFEGTGVHVPYDYEGVLVDEYSKDGIVQTWFRGWRFDSSGEWVRDTLEDT